jgi:hypothetical protein
MPVHPQTLLVVAVTTTIKMRNLLLSRRVEARPSRSFEALVFARNFGRSREKVAARELPRDQGCHREIGARSGPTAARTAKSFTGVSICPNNAVVDGFGRHRLIDPVRSCAGLHRDVRFAAAHPRCCHPRRPSNRGRERHKERTAWVKAVLNAPRCPHAERRPHGPGPGCGSGKVQGAERSVAHRAPHFYAADPLSCGAAPERSGTGSREASNTTTRSAMLSPRPARMCGQRSRLRRSTGQRQLNNFGCLEISAKSGAITATETQADCEADGYISIRAGLLANVTLSTDNVAKARVTVPQSGLPPWPNALHLGPIQ